MIQNMIKLAVGCDSIDTLYERQRQWLFDYNGSAATMAWTTRRPRAFEAVASGGSMYWVIKNHILVRQPILGFEADDDEKPGWSIILDPHLTRTVAVPRKAFQGWRYLPGDQAPPDRGRFVYGARDIHASPEVEQALKSLGLL